MKIYTYKYIHKYTSTNVNIVFHTWMEPRENLYHTEGKDDEPDLFVTSTFSRGL